MQKFQIGGGSISPAVIKHMQKSATPLKSAEFNSQQLSATQIGGGTISPNVKKHLPAASKAIMDGGSIHSHIAKHVQAQ